MIFFSVMNNIFCNHTQKENSGMLYKQAHTHTHTIVEAALVGIMGGFGVLFKHINLCTALCTLTV